MDFWSLQSDDCNDQIPARVYEYLRAQKSILGICGDAGDTDDVVRKAGFKHLASLEKAQPIGDALVNFLHDIRNGVTPSNNRKLVEFASRRAIRAQWPTCSTKFNQKTHHGRPLPHETSTAMNWTVHPISKLAEFSGPWDALARSRPGTPFLESAFLQPAIDTFGSNELRLCLNQENGQLQAAAITQPARKGMWQTFQPSQLPLGAWISREGVGLESAWTELLRQLPGLNVGLGITQLDSRFHTRPADGSNLRSSDYIQTSWVDIEGSFETYWESRGKNLRQNTRKQRNKLHAEGTSTRIECATAPEDVARAIEDYGKLESAGWKTADGTAIHPDNAQGRFYTQMLENFCRLGRGRIYRYWFGEKLVSMDLCIHDDATIVILKTTYDESYKTVSPSTLMRQDEFQQLFEEQRFQRIEFYGKVMEWHTRWTSNSRPIYHATSYRWSIINTLYAQLAQRRQPAKQVDANS